MKRNALLPLILTAFSVWTVPAYAAQMGEIIVDQGKLHQYPQENSKVLSTLPKGEKVTVSNLPTEGFYKTRTAKGETGWISGNELRAGDGGEAAQSPPPSDVKTRVRNKPPQRRIRPGSSEGEGAENSASPSETHTRFLLGAGIENLAYGGLSSYYENMPGLNPGTNIGLELQIPFNEWLSWAIRLNVMFGKTSETVTQSGAKQTVHFFNLPVQLGLVGSLVDTGTFRLGLGAYAGGVYSGKSSLSSVSIDQTTSTTTSNVTYPLDGWCATGALQIAYSLGPSIGFFLEAAYLYQQRSEVGATAIAPVPPLTLDISGWVSRLGIELRF